MRKTILVIIAAIVAIGAVVGGIVLHRVTYLSYPEGKDHIDYRDVPDNILLREVSIPASATYIARYSFYFCESLRKVHMHEGMEQIGARAFAGCRGLREIELPSTVWYIGAGAFRFCDNLQKVTMPPKLDSIRHNTFAYCFKLHEFTMPDSVTYIGTSAFDMCAELNNIELPSTLEYIGECVLRLRFAGQHYHPPKGQSPASHDVRQLHQLAAYHAFRTAGYNPPHGIAQVRQTAGDTYPQGHQVALPTRA